MIFDETLSLHNGKKKDHGKTPWSFFMSKDKKEIAKDI